jgi:DHA1 family bicyclomycin/chloramphenicol resistance-like MFS transporter
MTSLAPGRAVWLDRRTPPHVATLVALSALSALNMNFFLPSLPSIATAFDADYAVAQLAVSAYLATTAALQIALGPLSDLYGRRPVMLGSVVVFLVATAGCAVADSIEAFLAFRLVGSAVVSGLVLSRAVVRDMVGPAESASLIGYVTMGMALAPMLGPMAGGWLDENLGWRAGFVAIGALGVATLAVAWADLGETARSRGGGFAAQFAAYPTLAASRRFWSHAVMAAAASGAFFAFLGGGPYVATEVLGMSPAEAGFHFGFVALGYMAGNFLAGRLTARAGLTAMMLAGAAVALTGPALALGLFAAGLAHPMALFGPMLLVGLGNGLSLPSANAGMLSVRPELAGGASGLGGALMIGGGAAMSALAGALLGPGAGASPLLWAMLASSAAALAAAVWTAALERVEGPVGEA